MILNRIIAALTGAELAVHPRAGGGYDRFGVGQWTKLIPFGPHRRDLRAYGASQDVFHDAFDAFQDSFDDDADADDAVHHPGSRSPVQQQWVQTAPLHYSAGSRAFPSFGRYDEGTSMETSAFALPLDRATAFYNFAMVMLIIGAMVTIAATIGLIWASGLKNRYADETMARAVAQREQAKADAARANERAAELLLRAQQAQLAQEKTHLELEHVRAIAGWRHLSADQHDKIAKALQGHQMTINLLTPANDPEATQYAEEIAKTLKDAGLTVHSTTSVLPIPIRGLGMTMSQSDTATLLYAALRGAGLEIADLPERNPPMIVVGAKPSAFGPAMPPESQPQQPEQSQ